MSISTSLNVSEFCLEGRFLDFVIKDGSQLKALILGTTDGKYYVKLAKHLRVAFDLTLPRGTWLQVVGSKKYDVKKDQFILKAERVIAGRYQDCGINQPVKKQTILYCQKSDCMKRGGKLICEMLEKELSDRSLQDTVTIKGTGCMKNCKAGPNLVMSDRTRYTKVKPAQVPILVDKHFGQDVEIDVRNFVEVGR